MNNTIGFLISGNTSPFISDKYSNNNIFSLKSNTDLIGVGTITLTNGSSNIVGHGTNFLDATTGKGLSYWVQLWVVDSSNTLYLIYTDTISSNTDATILNHYIRSDLQGNYFPGNGNVFVGTTGTYKFWVTKTWSDGIYSLALGTSSYASDFSTALGLGSIAHGSHNLAGGYYTTTFNGASGSIAFGTSIGVTGSSSAVFGSNTGVYGSSCFAAGDSLLVDNNTTYSGAIGQWTKVSGSGNFSGGIGLQTKEVFASGTTCFNFSQNTSSQTAGRGALGTNSAILGGINHHIPSNTSRVAILGGNAIVAASAINDTVYLPKVRIGQGTGASLSTANANQNLIAKNSSTGDLEITNGAGILTGNTVDIKIATVGKGLYVKQGSNATFGRITLTGGTAVVSTNKITSISNVQLSIQSLGTVSVPQAIGVTARIANTSFTIKSSTLTDTSVISWWIIEPA